jgi:hypothetical protein
MREKSSTFSSRSLNLFALGQRQRALNADVQDGSRVEHLGVQLHLAVREAFDIEESLDHARQALGFAVNHPRHLLALLFVQIVAAHHLAGTLNGGERGPHFMRHEMDRLLVAGAVRFRFPQLPADHEVLPGGRRGHRYQPASTDPDRERSRPA